MFRQKILLLNRFLLTFLSVQIHGWDIFKWSLFVLLINYVTSFVSISILLSLNVDLPELLVGIEEIPMVQAVFFVTVSVFVEELLFRFPLALAVHRWGKSGRVLLTALILSIIFGAIHGSLYNIFIQGVIGLSYSLLFLKAGGFGKKYIQALLTVWMVHAVYNFLLLLLVFSAPGT